MFETHEQAVAAIEGLNAKKEIKGKTLFVSKFISTSENEQTKSTAPPISQQMNSTFKTNIFVRNIPKEVTEDEFTKTMAKVGKIISLKIKDTIITGENGQLIVVSKIGYVCYENVEDAQQCIRQYDQTHPFGIGSKAL
jgi:RNA recognition motif-containing protein